MLSWFKIIFLSLTGNILGLQALTIATPNSLFDELVKITELQKRNNSPATLGESQEVEQAVLEVKNKIHSLDKKLVAVKFTLENEVGVLGAAKIQLSNKLTSRADLFVVDYKYFLDFLHLQVYKKAKIPNLTIPSLLFFKSGKLLLPIESCENLLIDKNLESVEALIEDRLKSHN